jgi:hypothetical protein
MSRRDYSSRSGQLLGNGTLVWANSAAANTAVTLALALPSGQPGVPIEERAVVLVHNPSAVTALTVKYRLKWRDSAGNARSADLTSVAVAVNSTKAFIVDLGILAAGAEIVASNDTVLGGSDGFTAFCQVQQV